MKSQLAVVTVISAVLFVWGIIGTFMDTFEMKFLPVLVGLLGLNINGVLVYLLIRIERLEKQFQELSQEKSRGEP